MSSAAARQRAYRQRVAAGLVTLQVTVPEDELIEVLRAARQLDAIEPSRADLEAGLERLIELLRRA